MGPSAGSWLLTELTVENGIVPVRAARVRWGFPVTLLASMLYRVPNPFIYLYLLDNPLLQVRAEPHFTGHLNI